MAGVNHRNTSAGVEQQKSMISDAESKPARIGDLIQAANSGQKSGVLASRKTTKRAGKQPSFTSFNEIQGSPKASEKLTKSFINSDNKRCGSSNLIIGDRPGSPTMAKDESSKLMMRKKYPPGVTTRVMNQEMTKPQSNSVLDN